jgi:hypothetical protein
MPSSSLKPRHVAIAIVLLVIGAAALFPYSKIYDDGLWPITVVIHSMENRPIKGYSAEAMDDVEKARERLSVLMPMEVARAQKSLYSAVQEPKEEQPLQVEVPTSEVIESGLLWTSRRFFQYRGLLVVVEYEDGTLEGRAVEIPDLKKSQRLPPRLKALERSVVVEVP